MARTTAVTARAARGAGRRPSAGVVGRVSRATVSASAAARPTATCLPPSGPLGPGVTRTTVCTSGLTYVGGRVGSRTTTVRVTTGRRPPTPTTPSSTGAIASSAPSTVGARGRLPRRGPVTSPTATPCPGTTGPVRPASTRPATGRGPTAGTVSPVPGNGTPGTPTFLTGRAVPTCGASGPAPAPPGPTVAVATGVTASRGRAPRRHVCPVLSAVAGAGATGGPAFTVFAA